MVSGIHWLGFIVKELSPNGFIPCRGIAHLSSTGGKAAIESPKAGSFLPPSQGWGFGVSLPDLKPGRSLKPWGWGNAGPN